MAKKKAAANTHKPIEEVVPTDEQLRTLAGQLMDTCANVYHLPERLGFKMTDEIWERMEKQESIFKCEECNCWQSSEQRAFEGADHCDDCECNRIVEEQGENDEEDDE